MILIAGGRSLAEAKVQRDIFQGVALSPLLFIIAMMPLNHILRKCIADTNLVDRKKNMDDIKRFTKNEEELETLILAVRHRDWI